MSEGLSYTGRTSKPPIPAVVRVVDAFPMTVTGKIQKFVMRDAETQAR